MEEGQTHPTGVPDMVELAAAAAAGASALAVWWRDRQRCRQRNESGACGACGARWPDTGPGEPYLIHGRLVCEPCAEKAKRRMPWHFGILGGSAALAAGLIVAGQGVVALVAFPIASTVAMTLGAVQLMKLANRKAQRRIVTGDYPDIRAVRGGSTRDRSLVEGQAL